MEREPQDDGELLFEHLDNMERTHRLNSFMPDARALRFDLNTSDDIARLGLDPSRVPPEIRATWPRGAD